MNATTLNNHALKQKFDDMWKEARISGIHGHRSVGGYRASMYNALPLHSVQPLVDVMQELREKPKTKLFKQTNPIYKTSSRVSNQLKVDP